MWFMKNPQEKAETQLRQAVGYAQHAVLLAAEGDYSGAVQYYGTSLGLLKKAQDNALDDGQVKRQTCEILLSLADLHGQFDNEDESQSTYMEAINMARLLCRESESLENLKLFQYCMLEAASNLLDFQRFEDGLNQSKNLVDLSHKLLQEDQNSEELQHSYSYSLTLLMHFQEGLGDLQAAYEAAGDRCNFEMDLLEATPNHPSAGWRLADSIMDMTKFLEGERRADQYAVALGVMTDLKKSGRLQPHQVDTYKGLLKWRAGADVIVANCHANHDWVLQN